MMDNLAITFPSFLLDMVLLFLLLCAILYGVRLNRSVRAVQRNKAELAWLFARFAEHIARAEKVVLDMKRHAQEVQERHNKRTEQAERLESDLSYLLDKGNRIADQLEASVSGATHVVSRRAKGTPSLLEAKRAIPSQPTDTPLPASNHETLPSLHNLR